MCQNQASSQDEEMIDSKHAVAVAQEYLKQTGCSHSKRSGYLNERFQFYYIYKKKKHLVIMGY